MSKEKPLKELYDWAYNFNKYAVLKTDEGWLALGPGLLYLGKIHGDFESTHATVQEKITEREES